MAAPSTSYARGFPSSWASSASLFGGCGVTRLRRPSSPPRLPRFGLTMRSKPFPLRRLRPCEATASPPPEPPFREDRDSSAGFQEMFCRTQDAIRIFFAVFFWMSLFFWASAWDRNDDIRPNKKFRR